MSKRKTIAEEIVEGLEEFAADLQAGRDVTQKYNARKVALAAPTSEFGPERVRAAREALQASQAIFAQLLGASLETVRAWEQGKKNPSGIATRFLDEIARNPDYWRGRLRDLTLIKVVTTVAPAPENV